MVSRHRKNGCVASEIKISASCLLQQSLGYLLNEASHFSCTGKSGCPKRHRKKSGCPRTRFLSPKATPLAAGLDTHTHTSSRFTKQRFTRGWKTSGHCATPKVPCEGQRVATQPTQRAPRIQKNLLTYWSGIEQWVTL